MTDHMHHFLPFVNRLHTLHGCCNEILHCSVFHKIKSRPWLLDKHLQMSVLLLHNSRNWRQSCKNDDLCLFQSWINSINVGKFTYRGKMIEDIEINLFYNTVFLYFSQSGKERFGEHHRKIAWQNHSQIYDSNNVG